MANQLLDSLPASDRSAVNFELEQVDLSQDELLWEHGQEIEHVFFPEGGMISLLTSLGNRPAIETGTVGREGMVGLEVFLGVHNAPTRARCQVPGLAQRLPVDALIRLTDSSPLFSTQLLRYTAFTLAAANQLAACNLVHGLRERCARWLWTVGENVDSSSFLLTHEYLAQMLGVRRAGVTKALGSLSQDGIVSSRRGAITILDRQGLEAATCECQRVIRALHVSLAS